MFQEVPYCFLKHRIGYVTFTVSHLKGFYVLNVMGVFLLKPGGSAQAYFENMVSLLEQLSLVKSYLIFYCTVRICYSKYASGYYHPSNGGRWSYSLERFLRYLVYYFQKRLTQEQRNREAGAGMVHHFLGSSERAAFVKVVLKLIERGQYSKNEALAGTAAAAASVLSYVEPSLVLPLIVSRFHIALDTITATHQLKSAVTAVALVSRALLLASAKPPHLETDNSDCISSPVDYNNVLMVSMYNTLLGMDANDPPKTLATMQLFGSIFSSLAELGDKEDGNRVMLDINFSEWLDEFLCRIFSLLLHLEPNNQLYDSCNVKWEIYVLYNKKNVVHINVHCHRRASLSVSAADMLLADPTRPIAGQLDNPGCATKMQKNYTT
eukprot:Gb_28180 [translate_table: standard]